MIDCDMAGNDLVAFIRERQAQIAKLQQELEEARRALDEKPSRIVAGLKRAATAPKSRVAVKRGVRPALHKSPSGLDAIVPKSAAWWAREVIRAAGRPLHVNDLFKAIEGRGEKVNRITLVSALHRWNKKKAVFYLAGRNTFGLIEIKKG